MKRLWSPYIVRICPGHDVFNASRPWTLLPLISIPSSVISTGCIPKKGKVAEPGLVGVAPGKGEIKIPPVSVCHHVSTIGQRSFPTIL